MVRVKIFVEGGSGKGNDRESNIRCREGFSKLLKKAGFEGRMPQFSPGGGRDQIFNDFRKALVSDQEGCEYVLLVDSEDPLSSSTTPAWNHLNQRDHWERPLGVSDDQAQLMVTCMETWILADQGALAHIFGSSLRAGTLLPTANLESRTRHETQESLEAATRDCGKRKAYKKGKRSFQILGELDPEVLKRSLPHFRAFIEFLDGKLS